MNVNNKYAVIIKSVSPLRNTPSEDGERLDEVLFGMGINIISTENNGWYYVKTDYDYEGYINEKDIIFMTKDVFDQWIHKASFYVVQSLADILEKPMYNSPIIQTVTRGAFIIYSGENNEDWSKVFLPDGQSGWINKTFIKKHKKYHLKEELKLEEEVIRKNLVKTAKLYLNIQYRWGGKSTLGIDCSGLCSIAYLINGLIIYRDAVFMDKYMKKISIEKIKPGDLLFFPGHVAMYIGKNKYIHSNSKSQVVAINSLDENDDDYRNDLAKSIIAVGSIFE